MNHSKKAVLSAGLLLLLSSSLLLSCGEEAKNPSDNTKPAQKDPDVSETETEDPSVLHTNLPENLDFGGVTMSFYTHSDSPNFVEGQNGVYLNDVRFAAESHVEEKLHVNIVETLGDENYNVFEEMIRKLVQSNDDQYDFFTTMDRFLVGDTCSNMFRPLDDFEYIDLSQKYWNPNVTETFSIGHQHFYALTSFNLFSYMNTQCVYFNTQLAQDHDIEDLYSLVRNGKWTFDKMCEYASDLYQDLNGDSKRDDGDQYGFAHASAKHVPVTLMIGDACHTEALTKDQWDLFEYSYSDRFVEVLESIFRFCHEAQYAKLDTKKEVFTEGRALFYGSGFKYLEELRDTEIPFSMLPVPKYDENQESYYCRTYDTFFTMVPTTCQKDNEVGAVLEEYSCEAYNKVLPALIEATLKDKYCPDVETKEMIGIILDTRTLSLAEAFLHYQFGDEGLYNALIVPKSMKVASTLERMRGEIEKKLDELNDYFGK